MITDPNNSSHWLLLARDRLEKTDALFFRFGSSWSGVELLQEAAERYLKGYMVHHGWQLMKTHDLSLLIAQACQFDPQFANFAETSRILTEQFWEQHYPGGDLDEVGQDYPALRQSIGEMVALIESALAGSQAATARKFASEDLAGMYEGPGTAATNATVRAQLRKAQARVGE